MLVYSGLKECRCTRTDTVRRSRLTLLLCGTEGQG
jgi:hypothetical protein